MGEGREYISRTEENGNVRISEDVIATIAALSAIEIEGLSGLAANLGSDIAELLGRKNLGRGIKVRMEENNVTVDVAILIKYGYTIPDVAKQVQDAVFSGLEAMAGITASAINIHVGGIVFPKESKQRSSEK